MLSQFVVVGEISEPVLFVTDKASKLRLRLDDPKRNRTEFVEVVGKPELIDDSLQVGMVVAVSGSVGGKINDKGYFNLSLWAFNVTVIENGNGSTGYEPIVPKQRQTYSPPQQRRRPAPAPAAYSEDDDVPY